MEESWPSGVCLQRAGSKPPRAALAEDRCRERRGKGEPMWTRQVWIRKTSASEPAFRRRQYHNDIKTGGRSFSRDEPIGNSAYRVGGVRRIAGVSLIRALPWNCGNPNRDDKGEGQVKQSEAQSTDARDGGGSVRSSDDGAVMAPERRGRVVPAELHVNFSNLRRMSA